MLHTIRALSTFLVWLFPLTLSAQVSTNKVVGYLPTWWYGNQALSNTGMASFTHVIIFGAQADSVPPYLNTKGVDDGYWFQRYRDSVHVHGGKLLFSSAGGYPNRYMQVIGASPAKMKAYVDTVVAFAKAKGFDGIEVDWEFPHGMAKEFSALLGQFRKKLDGWRPKGILAIATYYSWLPTAYQADSLNLYCDIIMPMTYTMWMGNGESPYYTGFDTPVNEPTSYGLPSHNAALSSSATMKSFVDAGIDKSKLCVGISFEGTRFGGATGLNQPYSSWQFTSTVTNGASAGYPSIPVSGRIWDDQAKANYSLSGGYVWSFHDTLSVKAVVKFARENSYGGIMVYDYPAGYDTQLGDILIRVVSRETLRDTRPKRR
jgi:GH18 family chitinase